jgi:hypothetical protein
VAGVWVRRVHLPLLPRVLTHFPDANLSTHARLVAHRVVVD